MTSSVQQKIGEESALHHIFSQRHLLRISFLSYINMKESFRNYVWENLIGFDKFL